MGLIPVVLLIVGLLAVIVGALRHPTAPIGSILAGALLVLAAFGVLTP